MLVTPASMLCEIMFEKITLLNGVKSVQIEF